MKLIINISEEEYKRIIDGKWEGNPLADYIENGTPYEERPTGEWIKHIDNLYSEDSTEECPFCHEEQRLVGNDDNFCPNCGAKMQKGEG